ncbi:hypothetical protein GBAR_LOCUS2888 [Geodia barretti]|uniref:Uncharacterized protein n=2 Tax=Geodia barretti TaxID=519541 RepID=A0AA35R238_GEOBA|nr:hypothetical protein GBAR_LOCUS2888 [Geodia barretti]
MPGICSWRSQAACGVVPNLKLCCCWSTPTPTPGGGYLPMPTCCWTMRGLPVSERRSWKPTAAD